MKRVLGLVIPTALGLLAGSALMGLGLWLNPSLLEALA